MSDLTDAEPLLVSIPTAARLLGISRDLAYKLAREDALPVPVIRFSPHCWRVSMVQIRRLVESGSVPS